jgi:hypothetical protein
MPAPTPEEQIRFLTNIQRLLADGQFVSTYKYALLLALADVSIESGDDSGTSLEVDTHRLAEKFVDYYWRQTAPYVQPGEDRSQGILLQNTGRQAGIIGLLERARQTSNGKLSVIRHQPTKWKALVNAVAGIVRVMPLWKLQTVGKEKVDFLYGNVGKGKSITLKPGIVYCFRKFHGLLGDIVRGAWVRYVRRFNHDLLGTTEDLNEFLFGSERTGLKEVIPILRELQKDDCFYCGGRLTKGSIHVDHFIPWSRYPLDLGHNFVLAHDRPCNSRKSDHIAGIKHLNRWQERNEEQGSMLVAEFDRHGILHDLVKTQQIVNWAYSQTQRAGGLTWIRGVEFERLEVRQDDRLFQTEI